jgi:uncharacterized protein YeaO (DUF488 family)
MLTIKRIYEAPSEDDGLRVLVDRLWPRRVYAARDPECNHAVVLRDFGRDALSA